MQNDDWKKTFVLYYYETNLYLDKFILQKENIFEFFTKSFF